MTTNAELTIEQVRIYLRAVDSGRIEKRPLDGMQGLARLAAALDDQLQQEREARERLEKLVSHIADEVEAGLSQTRYPHSMNLRIIRGALHDAGRAALEPAVSTGTEAQG